MESMYRELNRERALKKEGKERKGKEIPQLILLSSLGIKEGSAIWNFRSFVWVLYVEEKESQTGSEREEFKSFVELFRPY